MSHNQVNKMREESYEMDSYKKVVLCLSLIVIATFSITCAIKVVEHQEENAMAQKAIEKVIKEHGEELMTVPGVVGMAQGLCNNKPCIKVYVIKKTPELDKKIPENIEGFPVSIEETGEIRALPKNRDSR